MDLNYIKTFLQVVAAGNFAKAAEQLQYAQSTVTAQIHAIEQELGVPLFERVGRKNYLTPTGEEFLKYATDLQNLLQRISGVGHQGSTTEFSLRIGILQSLLFGTFLDAIPVIREKYPNAVISIKVCNTQELLELLRHNALDMIFVSGPLNSDPSLACLYTKKTQMVFLSGYNHQLAVQRKISLEEVFKHPFVLTEPSGQTYSTFYSLVAITNQTVVCPIMVNDISAIAALLRNNLFLAFLPRTAISRFLHTDDLVVLDVDIPPQVYYSQILVRKSTWISPAMSDIVSLINKLNTMQ